MNRTLPLGPGPDASPVVQHLFGVGLAQSRQQRRHRGRQHGRAQLRTAVALGEQGQAGGVMHGDEARREVVAEELLLGRITTARKAASAGKTDLTNFIACGVQLFLYIFQ